MAAIEDAITDRVNKFLGKNGLDVGSQLSKKLGADEKRNPDIVIEETGVFMGKAEWEKNKGRGWSQAYNLINSSEITGSFLIVYPDELKEELKDEFDQHGGGRGQLDVLGDFEFRVAFLRQDRATDMDKVSLDELPGWLKENIYLERGPEPDPDRVVDILQVTVSKLTEELEDVGRFPDLFRNIIGSEQEDELKRDVRDAAAYLLVNQISFYRILSEEISGLPRLNPDGLDEPGGLQKYFRVVQEDIDYSPVFAPEVATDFSKESIQLIKEVIKVIHGISPEYIDHDVLGKVFHNLIPLSVRKKVAAYYTMNRPADLLTNLAINDADTTIMDPACGSGTFLVSSYKRKKNLLKKETSFNEKDHTKFLEEDITGIDIMPFAAHLSTIHLTLQEPLKQSDIPKIGVEDSTKLSPGDTIPSLSKRSRSEEQGTFIGLSEEVEGVGKGDIGLDAEPGQEIKLESVDLVVMNPPFTKQQSIANFSKKYKDKLSNRLSSYSCVIDKRMKFCYWFILLADKFLKDEGTIAAVLPVTFLRGYFARNLREWFLKNYKIKYTIIREKDPNFSEDTSFREVMIIAKKSKEKGYPAFISIKNLKEVSHTEIKDKRRELDPGDFRKLKNFNIIKRDQDNLDHNNMYKDFAFKDPKITDLWESIKDNEKLKEIGSFPVQIAHSNEPPKGNGNFKSLCINHPSDNLRRDHWVLKKEADDYIKARNRYSKDEFKIKKKYLYPCFRRITARNKIDQSNLKEYVIKEKFNDFNYFISLTDKKEINLDEWQKYLKDRRSYLCIATRFRVSSNKTNIVSYYTKKPRTWSRAGISAIKNLTKQRSKISSLFINSCLGILQIILKRRETEGAWIALDKYSLKNFKTLNFLEITEKETKKLEELFNKTKRKKFPALWKQLAMNCKKENLQKNEIKEIEKAFTDFRKYQGKTFKPRKEIDKTIIETLNIKNQDQFLNNIYRGLIKEIANLKKMK
ncbi:MAG: Type I restriction-modification system methyltransferase and restriction endonuclease [Candidatus Methanohalarchaeum thermophilum]|uniref:Type I restriction-modification system methyltransferase and restriction endonuclease n=1 Tax=Methanohalarchaeum thermophilum TaxID=1903181 RepID=A0A1Q6DWI5_METT1|nr:MAG: Type I restriction-modification system methyltransferase and restriction endonuclease [Candidatus Methanohalarchaeum thermophilum]